MACGGCAKRREQIKSWVNRQRGRMAKAGLRGNTPVTGVAPAPTTEKRKAEFYVNDINSTIGRLNRELVKCNKLGIRLTLGIEVVDGVQRVVLTKPLT